MGNRTTGSTSAGPAPHDVDRFPTAKKGLQRVLAEARLPEHPIEWLEVSWLASGEATYRVRAPRAEETEGGYLGIPE